MNKLYVLCQKQSKLFSFSFLFYQVYEHADMKCETAVYSLVSYRDTCGKHACIRAIGKLLVYRQRHATTRLRAYAGSEGQEILRMHKII